MSASVQPDKPGPVQDAAPCPLRRRRRAGFTFLELLVALGILVAVFAVMFTIFTTTLRAWNQGTEALSKLHHGDFVMEQLVQSMRSMAFFDSVPEFYEFRLDKGHAGGYPADTISWVTSSSAFMPLDSPYAEGLHRIVVTIGRTDRGQYGVAVRAKPHLSEEDDLDPEPWFVSTRVKGLRCEIFDDEIGAWQDRWDESNAIPSLVKITLEMEPEEAYEPPVRVQRAIQIPVAPAVTSRVDFVESE